MNEEWKERMRFNNEDKERWKFVVIVISLVDESLELTTYLYTSNLLVK